MILHDGLHRGESGYVRAGDGDIVAVRCGGCERNCNTIESTVLNFQRNLGWTHRTKPQTGHKQAD